jgi:hypothetical protein
MGGHAGTDIGVAARCSPRKFPRSTASSRVRVRVVFPQMCPRSAHDANRPSECRGALPVKWGAEVADLRHRFAWSSL